MTMRKISRVSIMVAIALFAGLIAFFLISSVPVKAQQDSSGFPSITVESYTYGGVTYEYAGGTIPVGATIDFRVWVDLYNVDPVTIGYGDGASDSYSFNGAFTHDFYHAYQSASEYAPVAHMPTDSGTFSGSVSQPVVIGGGSSTSTSGGGGGVSEPISTFNFSQALTVFSLIIGAIAVLVAVLPAGAGAVPIQATSYPSPTDAIVLGEVTTPQLLRSPETEKQEEAKTHFKECVNLKARYEDARKQADFARAMEEHTRQLLANAMLKLPKEYLKEYLKDKIKDAAVEIPIDVMMAFIGAEELEVLAEICKKAATTLIAEDEQGILAQLWENLQGYTAARDEAKRLEDLANFWFNDFKSTCPDWFN